MKRICEEKNICYIFNGLSIVMFAVLFCCTFLQTGENSLNLADEHIYFRKDSLAWNAGILVSATVFFCGLGKLFDKFFQSKNVRISFLVTVCVLSSAFGAYWLWACRTTPIADQNMLCHIAASFNKGDFDEFSRGGILRGILTIWAW